MLESDRSSTFESDFFSNTLHWSFEMRKLTHNRSHCTETAFCLTYIPNPIYDNIYSSLYLTDHIVNFSVKKPILPCVYDIKYLLTTRINLDHHWTGFLRSNTLARS